MVDTPHSAAEHPSVRHEPSDANFGWIMVILSIALFVGLIAYLLLWGFLVDYRTYQDSIKKSPYPLAPNQSTALPPQPRLEELERATYSDAENVFRRQEVRETTLNEYGRTGEKNFVRIPIEQAMRSLAGKGLPAREVPSSDEWKEQKRRSSGLVNGGESSSGRMFREGK
jgi:hypothetical protein